MMHRRLRYFLLCAAVVMVISACQSPAKPTTADKVDTPIVTAADVAETGTDVAPTSPLGGKMTGTFDARIETAMKSMFANAASTCVRELSDGLASADLMKCLQTKAIMAMEPSGLAVRYCDDGSIDEAFTCALQGVLLMKLREKSNTPISETAWNDLEAVLAGEATVAAMEEAFECMRAGQGETEIERQCMADNFAARLGGKPADTRLCLPLADDNVFGQCLGEAAALSLLEAAATRVKS